MLWLCAPQEEHPRIKSRRPWESERRSPGREEARVANAFCVRFLFLEREAIKNGFTLFVFQNIRESLIAVARQWAAVV